MIFRTRTVLEIPSCHSCMQVKTYQSSIPVDFRRLAEKNIPTCLSLSSSFCVAITVTSFTMRLLFRIESKRKSCAIWYILFCQSPKRFCECATARNTLWVYRRSSATKKARRKNQPPPAAAPGTRLDTESFQGKPLSAHGKRAEGLCCYVGSIIR